MTLEYRCWAGDVFINYSLKLTEELSSSPSTHLTQNWLKMTGINSTRHVADCTRMAWLPSVGQTTTNKWGLWPSTMQWVSLCLTIMLLNRELGSFYSDLCHDRKLYSLVQLSMLMFLVVECWKVCGLMLLVKNQSSLAIVPNATNFCLQWNLLATALTRVWANRDRFRLKASTYVLI